MINIRCTKSPPGNWPFAISADTFQEEVEGASEWSQVAHQGEGTDEFDEGDEHEGPEEGGHLINECRLINVITNFTSYNQIGILPTTYGSPPPDWSEVDMIPVI